MQSKNLLVRGKKCCDGKSTPTGFKIEKKGNKEISSCSST